jgi:hypothetical protein
VGSSEQAAKANAIIATAAALSATGVEIVRNMEVLLLAGCVT